MRRFVVQEWPEYYERRWPDRQDGPWRLRLRWAVIDDRLECVGLSLEPIEDKVTPLTSSDLRKLALSQLVEEGNVELFEARQQQVADVESGVQAGALSESLADDMATEAREEARLRAESARSRGGRPRVYDDDHFRRVADVYNDARRRKAASLTRAVAAHFDTTKSTAARWIARARDLGFLAPSRHQARVDVSDEDRPFDG